MSLDPYIILLYALIPMVVGLLGGALSTVYTPKEMLQNALQHYVAGIVIAAVAVELLPEIFNTGKLLTVSGGFAIGAIFMLVVHEFAHFLSDRVKFAAYPLGLVVGSALDFLIDGILIGIAFTAGKGSGIFIAISLSFCAFFVSMSVGSMLSKTYQSLASKGITLSIMAVMWPIGAFLGASVISLLPKEMIDETLAFGVAALLFLGVEELLGEAHKKAHGAWVSSAFFLGFLTILLFKF